MPASGPVPFKTTWSSLDVAAMASVLTDRRPHPARAQGTKAGHRDADAGRRILLAITLAARPSTCAVPAGLRVRQIGAYRAIVRTH